MWHFFHMTLCHMRNNETSELHHTYSFQPTMDCAILELLAFGLGGLQQLKENRYVCPLGV